MTDQVHLDAEIARIESAERPELVVTFADLYGRSPIKNMYVGTLRRAIIYKLGENAAGGPDRALQRRLAKLAEELRTTGTIKMDDRPVTKPGTQFIREWQGQTYRVTVTPDGYLYGDHVYRSLSRIAREITGTQWSGPAFFGLNQRGG